jgi:hypothetical protein
MANEIENALRAAAEKIVSYVEDAATMTVITKYVTVAPDAAADFTTAKPVAQSIVRLDGDTEVILPMRETSPGSGQLEVVAALKELHEANVAAATEYRARILQALVAALPSRLR